MAKKTLALPVPPGFYDPGYFREVNRQLDNLDNETIKRDTDIEVRNNRLILVSPNGTRYKLVVSDAGVVSAQGV